MGALQESDARHRARERLNAEVKTQLNKHFGFDVPHECQLETDAAGGAKLNLVLQFGASADFVNGDDVDTVMAAIPRLVNGVVREIQLLQIAGRWPVRD